MEGLGCTVPFGGGGGGGGLGRFSLVSNVKGVDHEVAKTPGRIIQRNGQAGGVAEVRAALALRSHSEAEKRRRERINSHLSTLRRLIPNTSKMEKAALLAEVIGQIRQLQTTADEVGRRWNVPSDTDEVMVEEEEEDGGGGGGGGKNHGERSRSIKATICCDDRPELLADLKQALESVLPLKTVSAEISTVGGRIRFAFVLAVTTTTCQEQEPGVITRSVQQTLKCVLARVSSSSSQRRRQQQPDFFSLRKHGRISPLESSSSSS